MTARKRSGQPVTTGGFVGRAVQLDRILYSLQSSAQLITLTGAGGIGKTQLAAEAMRRYRKVKPASVYWVRLAHLPKTADRTAVTAEIARSVLDLDTSRRSAWDAIVDSLSPQDDAGSSAQKVLVLDNCEHVLDSVGPVIADILYTVPRLTILATSRTVIGWSDEHLVEVPPLSAQDAAALFLHRAQALGHPIEGADQLAAVDAICRHMQNTPLFIRLAAARLRQRPLAGILQDLDRANSGDQRMGWSSGPSTAGDIRHHSIGDAIAWSYELCSDKERLLFERLSVFAAGYGIDPEYGGFAIGAEPEAIIEVCSDDTIAPAPEGSPPDAAAVRLSREEIPSLLDHLVDRSLVSLQIRENSVRYSLMECLHVFARQRLEARGIGTMSEQARLSRRHLHYYDDALHRAAVDWVGPQEQRVFDWLRTAWPNLVVAVHTSSATPIEAALGLRICIAIHAFPPITHTASIREIRMWTERALKATDSTPEDFPHTRTTAKALVAYSALRQGMHDEAERLLDECLAACGVHPDRRTAPQPTPDLPATVEFVWGMILWTLHNDAHAVPLLTSARRKALDSGEIGFAAIYGSAAAGAAARMPASDRQVDEVVDEIFHRAESTESPWTTTWAYLIKAIVSIERGDPSTALEFIHRTQGRNISASDQLEWVLLLRAWALGQTVVDTTDAAGRNRLVGHAAHSAYLFGVQRALHNKLGLEFQLLPHFAERNERTLTALKRFLGADAFDKEYERGTRIPPRITAFEELRENLLELREVKRSAGSSTTRKAPWDELSPAEQSVAILASAGITNAMIAARRGTSTRTVEAQLASVLRKLGIPSRHHIERCVPDERIAEVHREAQRWNGGDRQRRPRGRTDIPPQHGRKSRV